MVRFRKYNTIKSKIKKLTNSKNSKKEQKKEDVIKLETP